MSDEHQQVPGITNYLAMVAQKIEENGWIVQAVGGHDKPGDPEFQASYSYTVGLLPKVGFEFITFGLAPQTAAHFLNRLAEAATAGMRPEPGMVYRDLIAATSRDNYGHLLLPVDESRRWLSVAHAIYRPEGPITAYQFVWPDDEDRWPWDSDGQLRFLPVLCDRAQYVA